MVEHGVKYLHDGYTGSNPVLTTIESPSSSLGNSIMVIRQVILKIWVQVPRVV